jgi:hypothetical protein
MFREHSILKNLAFMLLEIIRYLELNADSMPVTVSGAAPGNGSLLVLLIRRSMTLS